MNGQASRNTDGACMSASGAWRPHDGAAGGGSMGGSSAALVSAASPSPSPPRSHASHRLFGPAERHGGRTPSREWAVGSRPASSNCLPPCPAPRTLCRRLAARGRTCRPTCFAAASPPPFRRWTSRRRCWRRAGSGLRCGWRAGHGRRPWRARRCRWGGVSAAHCCQV